MERPWKIKNGEHKYFLNLLRNVFRGAVGLGFKLQCIEKSTGCDGLAVIITDES